MFTHPIALGRSINLNLVQRLQRSGKTEVTAFFEDGSHETLKDQELAVHMRNTVQHAWPAEPGTKLIEYVDDLEDGVSYEVVVGWAIAADGVVYPVTKAGIGGDSSEEASILFPDGRVESAWHKYESFDLWLAAMRAERAGKEAESTGG